MKTIAGVCLLLALLACGVATASTGQSPGCERFCIKVKPRQAPEGSVFRFVGRDWRPNRRVRVTYGVYCRPGEACIRIAYTAFARTNENGRFVFRLRAGAEQEGDEEKGIVAGGSPTFSQRIRKHTVRRTPHYTVIVPAPGPY